MGPNFFFWREFHFLRTGLRGPPILATKPTTAEPTAITPGTARSKRRVMAISHAVMAARRAGRTPFSPRGPYERVAQRDIVGICRLHCVACVRRSRGRRRGELRGRTPTVHSVHATWRQAMATGQSWFQSRRGSRGRLHRPTRGACLAQPGQLPREAAEGGPSVRG